MDDQNEHVHHMQFDVWVWAFSREAENRESAAHTWQRELQGSLRFFLWAVAAASVLWGEK